MVIGCIGIKRLNFLLTEIKHLVVHPVLRRYGLAKALLAGAEGAATTPLVTASIREDNTASQRLFLNAGFTIVATAAVEDHNVKLVLKEK